MSTLRASLFICFCLLIRGSFGLLKLVRKTGGGDFGTFNQILEDVDIILNLTIEPRDVSGPFGIRFEATIDQGLVGVCRGLRINEVGDLLITAETLPDRETIFGFAGPQEVHEVTLSVSGVSFSCTIPLRVNLDQLLLRPFDTQGSGFGELTFTSQSASLTQVVRVFGDDFSRFPPQAAVPGICDANPGELVYSGDNIGEIITFDITTLVVDELQTNPDIVFDDVKAELCALALDLAATVADIIVDNPLINEDGAFQIEQPFIPRENNTIPAIDVEKRVIEQELSPEVVAELLNFNDRENFFVELIVPENPEFESILTTSLSFFSDTQTDFAPEIDPLLIFLQDIYPLELESDGSIVDFDSLTLFDGSFFASEEDPFPDPVFDVNFSFNATVDQTLTVFLDFEITKLLLTILPPHLEFLEGGSRADEDEIPPILPGFQVLEGSNHTLFIENINLNEMIVKAELDATIRLLNDPSLFTQAPSLSPTEEPLVINPFLNKFFDISFDENIEFVLDWTGFLASFGLLMVFNLEDFKQTEIGPFFEFFFDCGLSSFELTPRISGALFENDAIAIELNQLNDALAVAVVDVIESLLPIYQAVIPSAIEFLVQTTLTDIQLINETECTITNPVFDDVFAFPFDFSQGLINDLFSEIDNQQVNQILEQADLGDQPFFLFDAAGIEDGNVDEDSNGIGFTVAMPENEDGVIQNISIFLESASLSGFTNTHFNSLDLLRVIPEEESVNFPQELRTVLDFAREDNPFFLNLFFALYSDGGEELEFRDEANITIQFNRVDLLFDINFFYSIYDINGTKMEDVMNIGCWGNKLDFTGGVTRFNAILSEIDVRGNCDCSNDVMLQAFDFITSTEGHDELLEFLNDSLNRFGRLVITWFEEDNFDAFLRDSALFCSTDELEFEFQNITAEETELLIGSVLPVLTFLFFALLCPSLLAFLIARFTPLTLKTNTYHVNKERNKELLSKSKRKQGEEEDERSVSGEADSDGELLDSLHLTKPMFSNPVVPLFVKIMVPATLFVNIILFIIGDTGDAVVLNVQGNVFGLPYEDNGLQTFSVITFVVSLFQSGAIFSGLFLFLLSVFWPYLKIFIMIFCWVAPPSLLSLTRRGSIIETIDLLGRFSFIEFHFIIFVLVVFQLEAGSPSTSFLPQDDLIFLSLEIVPGVYLFTFAFAIGVSILLSNVLLVYQHNIENETRIRLREKHLHSLSKKRRGRPELVYDALARDKQMFQLSNWNFTVYEKKEARVIHQYTYSITKKATLIMAAIVIFSFVTLLCTAFVASVNIEFQGFLSYLIEFAGGDRNYQLSGFDLLIFVNQAYSLNFIVYFMSLLFFATITILPLVQIILLCFLLFKAVSVKGARRLTEAHHIITVWCCVDVFVLALTFAVLQLPRLTENAVAVLEFCDFLTGLVDGIFEPMGYMTQDDIESGCLALKSSVSSGGYLAVVAVLFLNIGNLFVSRLFYFYITDREKVIEVNEIQDIDRQTLLNPEAQETTVKLVHERLRLFGLITIDCEGVKKNLKRDFPKRLESKLGRTVAAPSSISKWYSDQKTMIAEHKSQMSSTVSKRPERPTESVVTFAQSQAPVSSQLPKKATDGVSTRPKRPDASVVSTAQSQLSKRPKRPAQSVLTTAQSTVLPKGARGNQNKKIKNPYITEEVEF